MEPPKVCFEHHMYWNSVFGWAFSVLISSKILVGSNVPQPKSGRCCVGASFFPLLFFLLLWKTKTLEKTVKSLTEERFLLFSWRCILRYTADLLHFVLLRALSVTSVKIPCVVIMVCLTHWETNWHVQLSIDHLRTNYNTECLLIRFFKIGCY